MKKHTFLTLVLFMSMLGFHANAQIGFKAYIFSPRGDLGPIFKTGTSYELNFLVDNFHGRVRSTFGINLASAAPRQDTVPTYSAGGSPMALSPQGTVYNKFRMYTLFVDESVRLFDIKKLSFYAGVRLILGLSKSSSTVYYPNDPTRAEKGQNDGYVGGVGGNLQAVYTIGSHVQACLQVGHNAMVEEEWSYSVAHNFYGIGINYRIKSN